MTEQSIETCETAPVESTPWMPLPEKVDPVMVM